MQLTQLAPSVRQGLAHAEPTAVSHIAFAERIRSANLLRIRCDSMELPAGTQMARAAANSDRFELVQA